ncbi:MAG: helix-turn-helix transcriptional regulator [Planctomycetes bacterium]|nr:helix-turn-helix transcriptional regulator [Planctomycetota bacterium]
MKPNTVRYRWELLPRLASEVEFARKAAAHRDLSELLTIVAHQSGHDLTLRKMRCAQIMSACVRGARLGGGPSAVLLAEHIEFLRDLSRLGSWPAVKRAMRRYVERLVLRVRPSGRGRMARIVASIRDELKATPAETRSLAQYAAELEISAGHLSRTFAAIAGRPFREELRRIRCEAARRILLETQAKVGVVAGMVGLRSASQFVADFRTQTGVTPGQFRRMAIRNKPRRRASRREGGKAKARSHAL